MTPPPASWLQGPFPLPSFMQQQVGAGFSYLLHMASLPELPLAHVLAPSDSWPPRSSPLDSRVSTTAFCPDHRSALPRASAHSSALLHRFSSFSISTRHHASLPRHLPVRRSLKLPSDSVWDARCSISSCVPESFRKVCAWNAATSLPDSHAKRNLRSWNSLLHPLIFGVAHNYC